MFYSDSPTYLPKIYGPSTFVKVFAFNEVASCLAINVFPVPGGPNRRIPLTCWSPNFSINEWGSLLDAKALLNRSPNCLSRPPIPKASNEKFLPKTFFWTSLLDLSLIFWFDSAIHVNLVSLLMNDRPFYEPMIRSIVMMYLWFLNKMTKVWSMDTKNPSNF